MKLGLKKIILQKEYSPLLTVLSTLIVYLIFFVAKVGGDFMYARFIIPCIPFIYFIIFYTFSLMNWRHLNMLLLLVLLLSASETFIRTKMFVDIDVNGKEVPLFPHGIADERYCYLYFSNTDKDVKRGKELKSLLKDIPYKAIIYGAQARFAYYADFDYCQEYFGLTDTLIAHSQIKERGRIGHEKHGTVEYFESKKIHFSFSAGSLKEDPYRIAHIDLPSGTINMEIISYDNKIIEKISQRLGSKFQYINFPNYLDTYIKDSLQAISSFDQLEVIYNNFSSYYFKNNDDKKGKRSLLKSLNELDPK